jgi:alkylated DNA nucleotide flippase Atl1
LGRRLLMSRLSYPRRQQLRRLGRAAAITVGGLAATFGAVAAALAGLAAIAVGLLLLAVAIAVRARHWWRLAARSGVGARSESQVQRALSVLQREGWRIRHSVRWRAGGDIDHVAIAPMGIAFAIETKTRSYHDAHLANVRAQAAWLAWRRRRWCRPGAVPVICVTRGPRLELMEQEVLVVSVEFLGQALRAATRSAQRPAFLGAGGARSPDRDARSAAQRLAHTPGELSGGVGRT